MGDARTPGDDDPMRTLEQMPAPRPVAVPADHDIPRSVIEMVASRPADVPRVYVNDPRPIVVVISERQSPLAAGH